VCSYELAPDDFRVAVARPRCGAARVQIYDPPDPELDSRDALMNFSDALREMVSYGAVHPLRFAALMFWCEYLFRGCTS
jgi:hypothetical protein